MNNNNPFLGDLQKKLFPPKPDTESVGNPEIDDIEGISDDDDEDIEIKSDSPTIRVRNLNEIKAGNFFPST
jgi:hypothetical protein